VHSVKVSKCCIYCDRPLSNSDDFEAELIAHLESSECIGDLERLCKPEHMTAAQEDAIKSRITASDPEEGWKTLYKALFPDVEDEDYPNPRKSTCR
jgi:hypothetical protein